MRMLDRLRNTRISARTAVLCIGALILILAAVVFAAKDSADSKPSRLEAAASAKAKPTSAESAKPTTRDGKDTTKPATKPTSEAKPSTAATTDRYAVIVERNLFKPVQPGSVTTGTTSPPPRNGKEAGKNGGNKGGTAPPPTNPEPPKNTGTLPPPGGGTSPPKPSGGDQNDFKKTIAFTGVVDGPAGKQALLENTTSKETRFVAKGENAFGCKVLDFNERSITLEKDGSRFTLNIGENKSDADAGTKAGGGGKPPDNPPK